MSAFILVGNEAVSLGHVVRAWFNAGSPASDELDEDTGKPCTARAAMLILTLASLEAHSGYEDRSMAGVSEKMTLRGAEAEHAWLVIRAHTAFVSAERTASLRGQEV